MNLCSLRTRLAALVAKLPRTGRVPRLCIVTHDDPQCERVARMAEAARLGDPILDVTFFEPTDADVIAALTPQRKDHA